MALRPLDIGCATLSIPNSEDRSLVWVRANMLRVFPCDAHLVRAGNRTCAAGDESAPLLAPPDGRPRADSINTRRALNPDLTSTGGNAACTEA